MYGEYYTNLYPRWCLQYKWAHTDLKLRFIKGVADIQSFISVDADWRHPTHKYTGWWCQSWSFFMKVNSKVFSGKRKYDITPMVVLVSHARSELNHLSRYQLSIWGESRKPIHFNQLSEDWSHVRWSHPEGHNTAATCYYYEPLLHSLSGHLGCTCTTEGLNKTWPTEHTR